MALPFEVRRGIPASEPAAFRHAARRTALTRWALLLALGGALALAFLVARGNDVRHAPLVPSGTVGVLVLDLSASVYEDAFGQTIRKLAASGERTGLVAFSDAGYELLPPGTPARELLPLLRFFNPQNAGSGGELPVTPWEGFRAGTQISQGLIAADEALQRAGAKHGSIVLVSDLEILPDEVLRLSAVAADLRQHGVRLRIVPLQPSEEKRRRVEQILGPSSFLRESDPSSPVRAPEQRSLAHAAPWTFLLVAGGLVLLLAVNEGALSRLEVRP
jgi:hypothetical protein